MGLNFFWYGNWLGWHLSSWSQKVAPIRVSKERTNFGHTAVVFSVGGWSREGRLWFYDPKGIKAIEEKTLLAGGTQPTTSRLGMRNRDVSNGTSE